MPKNKERSATSMPKILYVEEFWFGKSGQKINAYIIAYPWEEIDGRTPHEMEAISNVWLAVFICGWNRRTMNKCTQAR